MTSTHRRLLAALALSLGVHGLPFVADLWPKPQTTPRPPPLVAALRPPPADDLQAPLHLPEPPKPAAAKASPAPPPPTPAKPATPARAASWQDEVKRQLKKLDEAGELYPEAARSRGIEGQAVVLLVLDEGGNTVAARLEQSSGHALLDEAALRAARSLRSIPADAPRETLIPVRFRLR